APLVALMAGTLLAAVFALIFQPELVMGLGGNSGSAFESAYKGILNALTVETQIATDSPALSELFTSGGMAGMLGTIWLIICAMVFGGVMDGIGALERITESLLKLAKTTFG